MNRGERGRELRCEKNKKKEDARESGLGEKLDLGGRCCQINFKFVWYLPLCELCGERAEETIVHCLSDCPFSYSLSLSVNWDGTKGIGDDSIQWISIIK